MLSSLLSHDEIAALACGIVNDVRDEISCESMNAHFKRLLLLSVRRATSTFNFVNRQSIDSMSNCICGGLEDRNSIFHEASRMRLSSQRWRRVERRRKETTTRHTSRRSSTRVHWIGPLVDVHYGLESAQCPEHCTLLLRTSKHIAHRKEEEEEKEKRTRSEYNRSC